MTNPQSNGLASIIIPCWNQLAFTRQCLQSVFRHTRLAFELIVVDNGSTDGTGAYLAGVADAARVPVTVIGNATNQGFPAAINQGLKAARGGYLVLLNNDVVVTDGWLDQLVALVEAQTDLHKEVQEEQEADGGRDSTAETVREGATKDSKNTNGEKSKGCGLGIGLVGPMSNYAAPPQLAGEINYRDMEEMQTFARRWRDEHRGQWFTAGKLSGFCLLMKRAVYEAIGGLDERFGMGFFDDDDLALRARQAGFELAVAHDLFVHHFGSRTFQGNGVDAENLLEENGRKFAEKWGGAAVNGQRVMLRPWEGNSEFHAKTQREDAKTQRNASRSVEKVHENSQLLAPFASSSRPREKPLVRHVRVCLTMIVRNEQENLPACLESVRSLFDEIVVVDTGSVDRTREIAREFGAKVFEFAWIDDFAAARNEALARATGDYAFWLDADDVVDPDQREKLQALFDGLRRGDCNGGHAPQSGAYEGDLMDVKVLR
jgi:glycosyltransferase involved in cell wall biosynthesis